MALADGGSRSRRTTISGRHVRARAQAALQPNEWVVIPRSREVGQSFRSSIGTTLYSLVFAARAMARIRPHVVLCNGPGAMAP